MGCQQITVKHTHFSLRGQSILCIGFKKLQSNKHKSAYWDSPYVVCSVKTNHSQTHTFQLMDGLYFVWAVKHIYFSLRGQSVLCMGFKKNTVKQTQISLLGQSILCMGCQKITVKHTHFSLWNQSKL